MRHTLPLLLAAAAFLGVPTILAQESPTKSGEEKKPETPAKASETKEAEKTPSFAKRDDLVAHFEAEREEIRTKAEIEQRKQKPNPEILHGFQETFRAIDQRNLAALELYLSEHPKAEDLSAARYDIVDFTFRLGEWAKCAEAASTFAAQHGSENKDLTRQAAFLRASSLMNLEGKENDASAALEAVAKDHKGYFEANLARWSLVRAYVLANDIAKAKLAVADLLKDEEVQEDEDALRQARALNDALLVIGKEMPEASFVKADDSSETIKSINAAKTPYILWYWDTRDGLSLKAAKDVEEIAKANKDKLRVFAISVNKSAQVWKTHVASDKESSLIHLFEGRLDSSKLSAAQLGVDRYPLAVLVNADGSIYRFDTPMRDLERTIKSWLKK